jgi:hypothetical protein
MARTVSAGRVPRALAALLACAWSCGASAAPEAPLLAYLQARDGAIELRIADPATKKELRAQTLLERPLLTIWRLDRPEVITLRDSGFYRTDYRASPGVAAPIGDAAPAGLDTVDAWVAQDGRTLQVLASSAAHSGAVTCLLFAVPATGPWQKLNLPSPSPGADPGSCDGVAASDRAAARSVTSAELMRRQQCAASGSACDHLADDADATYGPVRRALLASARGLESVAIADPGATAYFLAAGVRVGETPHLANPVHLVARQGTRVQKPALRTPPQVQIGLAGRYALVAGEYDGSAPLVADLETGQVVLSPAKARDAVWLPVVPPASR